MKPFTVFMFACLSDYRPDTATSAQFNKIMNYPRCLSLFAVLLGLWINTGTAVAAVVIVTNNSDLSVESEISHGINGTSNDSDSTSFGAFTSVPGSFGDSLSVITQQTSLNFTGTADASASLSAVITDIGNTTTISATGSLDTNFNNIGSFTGSADARGDLQLLLDLDTTYDYLFDQTAFQAIGGALPAIITLSLESGNGFSWDNQMNTGTPPIFSGTLGPGQYSFRVGFDAHSTSGFGDFDFGYADFDITLSLTTVPLPAAFWLFCSGLMGLTGIARRKKAA